MQTRTLIIGGGLTGLSLANQLQRASRDFLLVEARERLGGRIKSLNVAGSKTDLGPSWIWPGQHRVAQLIGDLGLQTFEQWSTGAQLFEQASGEVLQNAGFMSMAGAMRIVGGTAALTDALAATLDPSKIKCGSTVLAVDRQRGALLANGRSVMAEQIIMCVPPRVAGEIRFQPPLPTAAATTLQAIPTWMGAHAKFVAIYERPFWREAGLSGDASSRRGPLAEIHDASPHPAEKGALFGFVGLSAAARREAAATLAQACVEQLVNLFGPAAAEPLATHVEDWSQQSFTATPADAAPPPGHPSYHMPEALTGLWDDELILAVTELSPDHGGLIEGALAAADYAASVVMAN